jgi:hypothetical protein
MQRSRADRDVNVGICLDGTQLAEREPATVFLDLAETPTVEIRTKPRRDDAPQELPNRWSVAARRRRELLRILWRLHDVHELSGIVAQLGRYFPRVLQIGSTKPRAIFHPFGEEFGPVCYLGRIDKMTLS